MPFPWAARAWAWLGSLQLTALSTNTNAFSFGGAVMELESPRSPCNFSIVWKTGTHMPSQARVEYGVVQLQTGDRISLVPITLDFSEDTCIDATQLFTCNAFVSEFDPLVTCAQAP